MCGIFLAQNTSLDIDILIDLFYQLKHRGPDCDKYFSLGGDNAISGVKEDANPLTFYGFHRLAIINPESGANQPFIDKENNVVLLCNGEIYNWHKLCEEHNLPAEESSDCEVILHLYNKFGFAETIKLLDGEFAIILHDRKNGIIYAARDICGIRPLYYSFNNGELFLASEIKAIPSAGGLQGRTWHIKPRMVYQFYDDKYITTPYWNFPLNYLPFSPKNKDSDLNLVDNKISDDLYQILYDSVSQRLESNRPIGFFLSGGLDSSLICAIAQRIKPGIKCFTIGCDGSPDVEAAKVVAQFLSVDLTVINFDIIQALNDLPHLIKHLETYDTTTIRASSAQFQLCKWIAANTDIKVVYSGEISDELCSGYLYSKLAPNKESLHADAIRLLSEIYEFDALRLDRTVASQGMEIRVPFMNKKYIEYVLQLDPEFRRCDNGNPEKLILRKMATKYNLLPPEIAFRQKEAFSDGVSGKNNWIGILKEYSLNLFCDIDFIDEMATYEYLPPHTLEEMLYRKIFDTMYPSCEHICPHFWLPQWTEVRDPSATLLQVYRLIQKN